MLTSELVSAEHNTIGTLEESVNRDNDVWYQLELDSGAFTLDASTSSLEPNAIGCQFDAITGFGENSSEERITFATVFDSILTSSEVFENSFEGTVGVRARNVHDDDSIVEFTLSDF